MNLQTIGNLVRLRYKLMWAKTRTRNGKMAVFFAGYLLFVMFLMIFTMGGIGAGVVAVRAGKAYLITASILGGLFMQALLATVVMGFGVNAVFADAELRRYPLTALERRVARHFLGILDPFWILILGLELGLAFGLYLVDAASLAMGLLAIALLFLSNYLLARVLALIVERVASKRGGSSILLASVICLCMLPAAVSPILAKNVHALDPLWRALSGTPPAAAAAAIVRSGWQSAWSLAVVLLWIFGLAAALVALEKRPPQRRVVQTTSLKFADFFDRLGGFFGPAEGPLVAHWLRFYSRNNRFRTIYPLAIPLVLFLVYTQSRQGGAKGQFASVLGVFAISGFMGTVQFAVNQFGHLGSGLRRYLLLPAEPAEILRAGSHALLLASGALIPAAMLVLLAFSPVPLDGRAAVMLLGAAVTALFFMHGLALWTTLFGARRANFYQSFGNDLSLAGNLVVIGGVLLLIFVPTLVGKFSPAAITPARWWITPLTALAAAAFYSTSLRRTGALVRIRKERLLAVVEGRS